MLSSIPHPASSGLRENHILARLPHIECLTFPQAPSCFETICSGTSFAKICVRHFSLPSLVSSELTGIVCHFISVLGPIKCACLLKGEFFL